LLHRRIDIEDAVTAHLLAAERAPAIGFGRYIVSSTSPFTRDHLMALRRDAAAVVQGLFPDCAELYAAHGWTLFPTIDRIYVNHAATAHLGWRPKYDFRHVLDSLRAGEDFRSPMAREIGSKGYHETIFEDGPYPVGT
jgi:UDP-glucose 4-epimerase